LAKKYDVSSVHSTHPGFAWLLKLPKSSHVIQILLYLPTMNSVKLRSPHSHKNFLRQLRVRVRVSESE